MISELIKKYLPLLTTSHIQQYASLQNVPITDEEAYTILLFLKHHAEELISNERVLELLRPQLREDLFLKIQDHYQKERIKYFP